MMCIVMNEALRDHWHFDPHHVCYVPKYSCAYHIYIIIVVVIVIVMIIIVCRAYHIHVLKIIVDLLFVRDI